MINVLRTPMFVPHWYTGTLHFSVRWKHRHVHQGLIASAHRTTTFFIKNCPRAALVHTYIEARVVGLS